MARHLQVRTAGYACQSLSLRFPRRTLASDASVSTTQTFGNQRLMPRLPVPELEESTAVYLASLRPLLTKEQYAQSAENVRDFTKPGGVGHRLQQQLKDFDKAQPHSWLEDAWLKYAYLIWRCPTMINVNYWAQFLDHPKAVLSTPPPRGTFTPQQVSRASALINNFLNVNAAINTEQLPPDTPKGRPLDMNQYKQLFGTTRIPKEGMDEIKSVWPSTSSHIVVLVRDQVYKVDVLGPSGERATVKAIENQLEHVIRHAEELSSKGQLQPPVGVLTSEDRDVWARARAQLEAHSATNRATLTVLDDALFAICLDDYTDHGSHDFDKTHMQLFHNYNGRNRWFDKTMSVIIANSGRAGLNGEHTPADAVVPGDIMNYALANEHPARDAPDAKTNLTLNKPAHMAWDVTGDMLRTIEQAEANAVKLINNVDSLILHPKEYGGDWIKANAKCSPDSYVQMALQLAYYRDQGKVTATYESASTRSFLHGRTECVRSCSQQSKDFVEAWDKKDVDRTHKLGLLRAAVDTHSQTMRAASMGKGCDRHFLGLRAMMQQNGEEPHPFFSDPAFALSSRFALSTSNMSPGKYIFGGFGAVVEDGYGVNYAIGDDTLGLKFSISSWRSSPATDSKRFREHLSSSLDSMKRTVQQ
ncbi:Carnitine O-acetyltransferase mitochondrial [Sorochytrium milnesiophthora]